MCEPTTKLEHLNVVLYVVFLLCVSCTEVHQNRFSFFTSCQFSVYLKSETFICGVCVCACVCLYVCVCVCGGALYGLSYVFCFCSHQTPLDISVEAGHFDVSEMILRHRVGVSYTSISLSYSPPMGQTVSLTQAVGVLTPLCLFFIAVPHVMLSVS